MNTLDAEPLDGLTFLPVALGRAADDISAQIRDAMARGVLKPGIRLPPERSLAVQFGVSRNTLREALRSLENSGVLVLRRGAQAGAYIKQSSGKGVATGLLDMYKLGGLTPEQLTDARILIETAIVRSACANCTADDIQALKDNLKLALALDQEQRAQERIEANLDFHRIVARATHNPLLVTLMNAILEVMQVFVRSIGPYEASFIFASRKRFIALLEARDEAGAAAEMEKSLRRLQTRYLVKAP